MAAIGSLVFCTDCGNLLDSANGDDTVVLICDVCGAKCKDTSSKVITTSSKPSAFPSKLRDKLSGDVQAVDESVLNNEQHANEACEQCGEQEVTFHTLQLRGADEGSTVFYTCKSCGHKWNTNN